MKFKGNGIVWDAERKRSLCQFVDGVVEVDERAGKILVNLGFEQISVGKDYTETNSEDQESEAEEKGKTEIPTDWKLLQKKAIELNIPVRGKNKKELTELVKQKLEE